MTIKTRTLAVLSALVCATTLAQADATLTNRYEFNGTLNDSVGTTGAAASGTGTYSEAPGFGGGTPTGATNPSQSLQVGQTTDVRSGFTINSAAYSGTGSISLWLRSDLAATTNSQADYVFNQGGDWQKGIRLFLRDNNSNQLRFAIGDTTIGTWSAGVTQDTWYHVAVTWDTANTSAFFYVNGALIGSSTSVAASKFATTNINVGNWSFPAGTSSSYLENQFKGAIYDFQIYSGLLDAGQVAFLAVNPGLAIAVPEPGTLVLFLGSVSLAWTVACHRRRTRRA
ncbi:anchor protein [Opitutaceae bacterium TAV5]|nr:anchor protein [Opitutaceae bacterium TAV5]